MWCLYFAASWQRKPHAGKLFAAGLLLGFAVSLRYTEAILALPVVFLWACSLFDAIRAPANADRKLLIRKMLAHGTFGIAGGLLGVMPLLVYQWHAFGSPLTTGYSLSGEASAFSIRSFMNHFAFALKSVLGFSTGISL